MTYEETYTKALQYSAEEAANIQYKGSNSDKAGMLANHTATTKEDGSLLALADLMEEHEHPIAPYLQRAVNEKATAEGSEDHHYSLGLHHAARTQPVGNTYNQPPSLFPLLNTHGCVNLNYLHLPEDKHYFHIHITGKDNPESATATAGRSFLLPVTPEDVHSYANSLEQMEGAKGYGSQSKHLREAITVTPPEADGFQRRHELATRPLSKEV